MKRIAAIMAILLCSLAITSMVFAKQLKVEPVETRTEEECISGWGQGCIIPKPVPPIPPRPPIPEYTWYEGATVNKHSLRTEPVWFVTIRPMRYPWRTYSILMIDYDEFYTMREVYNRYDWRTGTRIVKYRAYDGSVMTLLERGSSTSGTFKNYIINIQRIGPYPIILEREVQPLFERAATQISRETGIEAKTILETQTSQ